MHVCTCLAKATVATHYKEETITTVYIAVVHRVQFLNQALVWFLSIASVRELQYVCVRPQGY